MLRQVVFPLARRSVFNRQASNASGATATATAILIKRTTAAFERASFHTTTRAYDEEDGDVPVKAPRKRKTAAATKATTTDGATTKTTKKKAAAPKKATKPKVAKVKAAPKPSM